MATIEKLLGLLSGLIIGSAQLIYLINTVTKKVRPSPLSWIGWAFLMGTSVVSQVYTKGWQWSITSVLCSTAGCLTIGIAALVTRNYSLHRKDWQYVVWSALCVGIYLLSGNPWMTTGFAVCADAILGVPTVVKAWRDPVSERSAAWVLGVVASTLALIICVGHDWIYVLFPAYLFLFNGMMTYLTRLPRGRSVDDLFKSRRIGG
jgi:hypothetical protein